MARRSWSVVIALVSACGDGVAATGSTSTSAGGSTVGSEGSSGETGVAPTSSTGTSTGSQGMTEAATTGSATTGTTEAPGETSSGEPGSSGEPASTSSTGGDTTGETGSTGEMPVCLAPVESAGGVVNFGGPGTEFTSAFAIGPDGGRYSGGAFSGNVDLKPGGGAGFVQQGKGQNMWLSKLSADGDYLYGYAWATSLGGACSVQGALADADGGVYVIGHFLNDIDLDPGPGVDMHSVGEEPGARGAYLLRLGPAGEYLWGRSWGPTVLAFGLGRSDDGSVFVSGYFRGAVDFDPGPGVDAQEATKFVGGASTFLSRFDADGNYLWGRSWGDGGSVYGFHLAVDAAGNAVVGGRVQNTADLDPGPIVQLHETQGAADFQVSRFMADGSLVFAIGLGGGGYENAQGVDVAPDGHVWVLGDSNGAVVDVDPGVGETLVINPGTGYQNFAARYDEAGAFVQVLSFTGQDGLRAIACDCDGQLYLGGNFEGEVDLDPGPGVAMHVSAGHVDAFTVALDAAGAYRWSRSWPNLEFSGTSDLVLDGDRMLHAQIDFVGTIDADGGPGELLIPSAGNQDVMLQRLRPSDGAW